MAGDLNESDLTDSDLTDSDLTDSDLTDSDWLDELALAVLAAPATLGSVRMIALDGPSGSGKSTIAADLMRCFARNGFCDAALVPTDHFATWDEPFDWWPRLESGVLQPLSVGRPANYLANDWTSGEPVPIVPVSFEPPTVLVLEGVSASRRALGNRAVVTCWIEVPDAALRMERAVSRDGEASRVHLRRWQLDEQAWFERDDTKARASRIRYLI